jgi:DNA-binding GntR family transcriptional regulator
MSPRGPSRFSFFGVSDIKHHKSREFADGAALSDFDFLNGCKDACLAKAGRKVRTRLKSDLGPLTVSVMLSETPESPSKAAAEMPLLPIDRQTSLGELAYVSLKEAIVRGQFSAGQKLTVRAVAQALGVSTTPARDAIMRLIGEGALVNSGPKTVIIPPLTLSALDEVTSIRLVLEGLAAGLAAERLPKEAVTKLQGLQSQINTALDAADYPTALKANKAFHFTIYEGAQMPRLVSMIESLWVRIGPSLNDLYPEFATSRVGVGNHMEAIAGLETGDRARVQAAIEKDIRDGYRRLASRIHGAK